MKTYTINARGIYRMSLIDTIQATSQALALRKFVEKYEDVHSIWLRLISITEE